MSNDRHERIRKAPTPGEWYWTDAHRTPDGRKTWSLIGDGGFGILSCDGEENSPQGVNAADAELIAAAPELLRALKKVAHALEWFAHGRCRGFDDGPPLSTSEAVELAERTIAKALGHDDAALEQEADRG